jgi:hypothetical protein
VSGNGTDPQVPPPLSLLAADLTYFSVADRMLVNVAKLLEGQGATFGDVVSAVTYIKHPEDAGRLRAKFQEAGFEGFPNAAGIVEPRARNPDKVDRRVRHVCTYTQSRDERSLQGLPEGASGAGASLYLSTATQPSRAGVPLFPFNMPKS